MKRVLSILVLVVVALLINLLIISNVFGQSLRIIRPVVKPGAEFFNVVSCKSSAPTFITRVQSQRQLDKYRSFFPKSSCVTDLNIRSQDELFMLVKSYYDSGRSQFFVLRQIQLVDVAINK